MQTKLITLFIVSILLVGCTSTNSIKKSAAYKGIYDEKPVSILIMPPINRSTNVEAKEFFHTTLNVALANKGYYVLPAFLSLEMMKKESAYDAELFLNGSVEKFGEYFGADVVLFTVINKWNKSALTAKVDVEVEYILKSTHTNEIIFQRTGDIVYDASYRTGATGLLGALADIAASAINTATVSYVKLGRVCNVYTLNDMPAGKYNPKYGLDGEELAGEQTFKATLNSNNN